MTYDTRVRLLWTCNRLLRCSKATWECIFCCAHKRIPFRCKSLTIMKKFELFEYKSFAGNSQHPSSSVESEQSTCPSQMSFEKPNLRWSRHVQFSSSVPSSQWKIRSHRWSMLIICGILIEWNETENCWTTNPIRSSLCASKGVRFNVLLDYRFVCGFVRVIEVNGINRCRVTRRYARISSVAAQPQVDPIYGALNFVFTSEAVNKSVAPLRLCDAFVAAPDADMTGTVLTRAVWWHRQVGTRVFFYPIEV